jgi:putative membrane protein
MSWNWDPVVITGLVATMAVYVARWRRVRRSDGPKAAPIWRLLCFATGLLVVFAALISPVDSVGEHLFAGHMFQHVLLLDLAPIFVLLGFTKVFLRPVTKRLMRIEQAAGPLGHPAFAIFAYTAGMAVWHIPVLYDAAVENEFIHIVEHMTFLAVGFLYWWHVLSPIPSRQRLKGMGPVMYMTSTKVLLGMLGVVLTFSPEALYDVYADEPKYWMMTPYDAQAVGGAMMAFEQSIVMVWAAAWLFMRALGDSERQERRRERFGSDPIADAYGPPGYDPSGGADDEDDEPEASAGNAAGGSSAGAGNGNGTGGSSPGAGGGNGGQAGKPDPATGDPSDQRSAPSTMVS